MTMRPLTKEEKQRVRELTGRLNKDLKELYALVSPLVLYENFCRMMSGLREDIFQVNKGLENIKRIREFLGQLPESQDLADLKHALDKLRV